MFGKTIGIKGYIGDRQRHWYTQIYLLKQAAECSLVCYKLNEIALRKCESGCEGCSGMSLFLNSIRTSGTGEVII